MSILSPAVFSRATLVCYILFACFTRASASDVAGCSCGFYDPSTDLIFTDSTIAYFNETQDLPSETFVIKTFEDRYEKGWNAIYRKGANDSAVEIANDPSARDTQTLALYCNPSTPDHLVKGAYVRTARQDLFYGSFRTSMRAPRKWFPGSALSMGLYHNLSESWDVNVMNTDHREYAWVSMLAQSAFPNLWLGVNFTTLQDEGMSPWYYEEYRVDWTPKRIDYYIGGRLQRSMTRELNGTLPSTPAALNWQHWSTGNKYSTQGPPVDRGVANLKSVRLFFNSSTTTEAQQDDFDARCQPSMACSMNDVSLRGSSPYSKQATQEWVQKNPPLPLRWIPISIDIVLGFISTMLVVKTLNRRADWAKVLQKLSFGKKGTGCREPDSNPASGTSSPVHLPSGGQSIDTCGSGTNTARNYSSHPGSIRTGPYTESISLAGDTATGTPTIVSPSTSNANLHQASLNDHRTRHLYSSEVNNPFLSDAEKAALALYIHPNRPIETSDPVEPTAAAQGIQSPPPEGAPLLIIEEKEMDRHVTTTAVLTKADAQTGGTTLANGTKRIDYLSGFISISAILVTMNHFGQTYFDSVITPSTPEHSQSEIIARKTIGPYLLNPLWIGPFLLISTRFLVSGYLKNGKLDSLASKITGRPFRLLIPVAFIAMLEYFFMDLGAVNWLEYLASVTWSSWPFVVIPTNAGTFISELVELAYVIPNAAPQITYYYCTGVLWTIPVQLQGAWQTILAVIMVREIKTPWKRFSFYAFCIVNHWYALSWGSYYYCGVLLADLDITYKFTKYLYARPLLYYPLFISVVLIAQTGFILDLVSEWTGGLYASIEFAWHPDITTGLSISQAGRTEYPDYFIPRLSALISTVFMQLAVEISPTLQKFLSMKLFQWLFPHIFTIYLIHGFIFWSVGSALCIGLFAAGLPYWACVFIVAIVCYAVLFGSMPLLTPIIELVGKSVTQGIWEHASQEPAPRRQTLYPFGNEIFDKPHGVWPVAATGEAEVTVEKDVLKGEKGKTSVTIVHVPEQAVAETGWRTIDLNK